MINQQQIRENLENLRREIKQLTDREITLVAVTKTHPDEIYQVCVNLGINQIGENRIQELCTKNATHPDARKQLNIHLIGSLQANKVRFLEGNVDTMDTLSSHEILNKIEEKWNGDKKLSVLLQINTTGENQKSGLLHDDYPTIMHLAKSCVASKKVQLEGVMTMGPTPHDNFDISDPDYARLTLAAFNRLRLLRDRMQDDLQCKLPRLSMGMSHDYRLAIESGATEIRVGSLIFGSR